MNFAEKAIDYCKDDFLTGGLPHHLRDFHPDDFKIFSEKLFPEILRFFATLMPDDKNKYIIACNYRIQKDNTYIPIQQLTNCSFSNYNSLFTHSFSVVDKDSESKHDNTIKLVITKILPKGEEIVLQKKFCQEHLSLLTDREKEIIMLAKKGYSSKEIASRLSISQYTVRNHKKKMMEKTNTYNIAGLINYFITNENS